MCFDQWNLLSYFALLTHRATCNIVRANHKLKDWLCHLPIRTAYYYLVIPLSFG